MEGIIVLFVIPNSKIILLYGDENIGILFIVFHRIHEIIDI